MGDFWSVRLDMYIVHFMRNFHLLEENNIPYSFTKMRGMVNALKVQISQIEKIEIDETCHKLSKMPFNPLQNDIRQKW